MWKRENDPARLGSQAMQGNNQMENVSNQVQLARCPCPLLLKDLQGISGLSDVVAGDVSFPPAEKRAGHTLMEEAKRKGYSCLRRLIEMGSKALVQTHLGRADTTAGLSLLPSSPGHPTGGQAACPHPWVPKGCVCPPVPEHHGHGQWELSPVLVKGFPPGQVALLQDEVLLALVQLQVLGIHWLVVVEGHHLLHLPCCAGGWLRRQRLHHHLPTGRGRAWDTVRLAHTPRETLPRPGRAVDSGKVSAVFVSAPMCISTRTPISFPWTFYQNIFPHFHKKISVFSLPFGLTCDFSSLHQGFNLSGKSQG